MFHFSAGSLHWRGALTGMCEFVQECNGSGTLAQIETDAAPARCGRYVGLQSDAFLRDYSCVQMVEISSSLAFSSEKQIS